MSLAIYCADNQAACISADHVPPLRPAGGQDIAALHPRSVAPIFRKCFDQMSLRAQENADLEQWMFDETFGDPDDG